MKLLHEVHVGSVFWEPENLKGFSLPVLLWKTRGLNVSATQFSATLYSVMSLLVFPFFSDVPLFKDLGFCLPITLVCMKL